MFYNDVVKSQSFSRPVSLDCEKGKQDGARIGQLPFSQVYKVLVKSFPLLTWALLFRMLWVYFEMVTFSLPLPEIQGFYLALHHWSHSSLSLYSRHRQYSKYCIKF